jgi:hypothetical protein
MDEIFGSHPSFREQVVAIGRVNISRLFNGALWALLSSLVCIVPNPLAAQSASYSDAHVKAAYILKLESFVEFPEKNSVSRICIVGDDLIGSSMAQIASGKQSDFKIDKVFPSSSFEGCRMVFIAESVEESLGQILYTLSKRSILTVSDIKGFVNKGGMIGFVNMNDRVKLEVNTKPALDSGLVISSKLLEVAYRVIR